ncbi:MAG: archease [Sandaracinaceae bacterium]|nr:archease [Sandaracinaceae bacterium]
MAASHRFFDHTGDSGVDVEAGSREELFAEAAVAFVHLLTDAVDRIEARESVELEVSGMDDEDLLVALGNELLYLFEVEGLLVLRLEDVEIEDGVLCARAIGEHFAEDRHPIARPIKAVTHHGASVRNENSVWKARLIYDL